MSSKTFVILKPDALERGLVHQVMQRFFDAGFKIEHLHYRVVDKHLIRSHYDEVILREGPEFVDWLDEFFVGKPTIPMVLSYPGNDGIQLARDMLGHRSPHQAEPGTIRGDLGLKTGDPNGPSMNLIHASDSIEAYEKEKDLWFNATKF